VPDKDAMKCLSYGCYERVDINDMDNYFFQYGNHVKYSYIRTIENISYKLTRRITKKSK
jgi:hypothetical protein